MSLLRTCAWLTAGVSSTGAYTRYSTATKTSATTNSHKLQQQQQCRGNTKTLHLMLHHDLFSHTVCFFLITIPIYLSKLNYAKLSVEVKMIPVSSSELNPVPEATFCFRFDCKVTEIDLMPILLVSTACNGERMIRGVNVL